MWIVALFYTRVELFLWSCLTKLWTQIGNNHFSKPQYLHVFLIILLYFIISLFASTYLLFIYQTRPSPSQRLSQVQQITFYSCRNSNHTWQRPDSEVYGGRGTCKEMYPCPFDVQAVVGIRIPGSNVLPGAEEESYSFF